MRRYLDPLNLSGRADRVRPLELFRSVLIGLGKTHERHGEMLVVEIERQVSALPGLGAVSFGVRHRTPLTVPSPDSKWTGGNLFSQINNLPDTGAVQKFSHLQIDVLMKSIWGGVVATARQPFTGHPRPHATTTQNPIFPRVRARGG